MPLKKCTSKIIAKQRYGIASLHLQAPVTEIILAAVLDCPRKVVVEAFFASGAVPYQKVDDRYVTTVGQVVAAIEKSTRLKSQRNGGDA